MKQLIKNQTFDEERALYGLKNARVENCVFAGEADGESAFKEASDIEVAGCRMALRYPLWHTRDHRVFDTVFEESSRAAVWYARNGHYEGCTFNGIKAFRECRGVVLKDCRASSDELLWKCEGFRVEDSLLRGEYLLFESKNGVVCSIEMKGKYSFQYIKNVTVRNSVLDTKDAFWHAENVTVENCTLKGEYLGWYSKNLTLRNCRIIGTQPLCYCKGLVLEKCTMEQTDLAFEYSEVTADVKGHILSVKNVSEGIICADSIGQVISDGSIRENNCRIIVKE